VLGIDVDVLHLSEVDHHATVSDRAPGDVVPTTPNRHFQARVPRYLERGDDVARRTGADNERGPTVNETVVDGTCLIVTRMLGGQDPSRDLTFELVEEAGF
jgi:hypothetical protein